MMTSEVAAKTTTETQLTIYPIPGNPDHMRHIVTCATRRLSLSEPAGLQQHLALTSPRRHDPLALQAASLAYFKYIGYLYDPGQSLSQQVACYLHTQIQAYQQTHSQLSTQALKNLLPQGITQLLVRNFATILYPGTWQKNGKDLIRFLLVNSHLELYLQEEHVSQIFALLQHDLSIPLSRVSSVHPSMETLVRNTLNTHKEAPLTPTLICQALLSALLSCTRQKQNELNCYVIACIPYLTAHFPQHFLEHLYQRLHEGQLSLPGQKMPLASLLPMLTLARQWHQLPAVCTAEFLCSSTMQQILEAENLQHRTSRHSHAQPLALLQQLAESQEQYEAICLRLHGFTDNLLLQFFIRTTEYCYINTSSAHCKAILMLIQTILKENISHLPQELADDLIKNVMSQIFFINPSQAYLEASIPKIEGYPQEITHLYQYTHQSSLRFYIRDAQSFKIIHSLTDLIFSLETLLYMAFQSAMASHPTLTCPPSFLHSLTSHDLARRLSAYFPHLSKQQKQELTLLCTQFNTCLVPSCGGILFDVLNTIAPNCHRWVNNHHPLSADLIVRTLHRIISPRASKENTGSYFPLTLDGHCMTLHLTPHHPLMQTPLQLQNALDKLQEAGRKILSQPISREQLVEFVNICYPHKDDTQRLLHRLQLTPIDTLEQALLALLVVVDKADVARVSDLFNNHYSKHLVSKIPFELLLEHLKISIDANKVRKLFEDETQMSALHPYHICHTLRNVLVANGHHISKAQIQNALGKFITMKPYLDLGDLNYLNSHTITFGDVPDYVHLVLDYHLATEQFVFCRSTSHDLWQDEQFKGLLTCVLPKMPAKQPPLKI